MNEEEWQTVELKGKPMRKGGKDITLLLLGETGVGKSTWINGFANFLQYGTLDEAEKNSTLCVIPASFTMTDDNYEERVITTGIDKNEVMEAGQSATQHPQSYIFPHEGGLIRLIDTPGIGDVRGVEQDKKNFQLILDHISHLEELQIICILLKPNNARLNIMFSFCIKELLTHLHRDACRNIVFCFTNSRSTFYRPGDTLPALRKLLEENNDVQIPLKQSTLYCMDNESIRFLYALKAGINFTPDERNNYISSWDKSVAEVKRLLDHSNEQSPHSIQNTLSLNSARQTILALGSPMAEITRSIQINIANGEKQKEELATSKLSKDELSKNLVIREVDVRMEMLPEPRTVCTSIKCVEFIDVGLRTKTNYKTHCHANCGRGKQKHYKIANMVGHKSLRKCSAFDSKGNCKHCKCSWKVHMKITYETFTETREIHDFVKQREIDQKENAIKRIEDFLDALEQHLNELWEEQKEITKASLTFAAFLKKNAITPYNDALIAYLMHFINEEKNKVGRGGDPSVLERLEEMKENYMDQMQRLQKAMEKGGNDGKEISPEDLDRCVENLYHLKHCGQNLKQMVSASLHHSAMSDYTEKCIERSGSFTTTTSTVKTKKPGFFDFLRTSAGPPVPKRPPTHEKIRREPSTDKNIGVTKNSTVKNTTWYTGNVSVPTGQDQGRLPAQSRPPLPSRPPTKLLPKKPSSSGVPPLPNSTKPKPVSLNSKPSGSSGGPPPPPPPLPTAEMLNTTPCAVPTVNSNSALLDQIRSKELRAVDDDDGNAVVKSPGTNLNSSPSSAGDQLMDAIRTAIQGRGLYTQNTTENDVDSDSEFDFD